ncbi:probable folate-biopterin transporter 7 [Rutidosis leptorrhynchoides]|uniref:probable folate-biopterin transporter 7 n=1 Tax=Rutidosis leptorrhynchoides TaxID=125765 RepID=UPI003A9910DF
METSTDNKLDSITKSSNDTIKYHRNRSNSSTEKENKVKLLLGLGFWMQGFRCFPWMAVTFFLKDGLRVDPASLQILQNSANLPMVAKPFYGLVSDSFYVFGQHRIPYIAFGALLQAISWFAIASSSSSTISFFTITVYLFLGNFGAAIVKVVNDALIAEFGKQTTFKSDLQSFVWVAASIGGIMGNLLGGVSIDQFSARSMFLSFGTLLTIQFFITISVSESSLNLPKNQSNHGIKRQLSDLVTVLRKPEMYRPILWFAGSCAIIPALTGSIFFYQTQHLKIESSVLGISKVVGQVAMLLWGVVYNRYLKSITPRKLISSIQITLAFLMLSDALFVKGFYRTMGIQDPVYVVVVSGLLEVLYLFKILPFSVLMAKLCPPGCEGSLMAFVTSSITLALIVSGYLGVALSSYVEVTKTDFSGLPKGLLIQAAFTVLPLFWSSFIPDVPKVKAVKKDL